MEKEVKYYELSLKADRVSLVDSRSEVTIAINHICSVIIG